MRNEIRALNHKIKSLLHDVTIVLFAIYLSKNQKKNLQKMRRDLG